jgi:hypothetical protein
MKLAQAIDLAGYQAQQEMNIYNQVSMSYKDKPKI